MTRLQKRIAYIATIIVGSTVYYVSIDNLMNAATYTNLLFFLAGTFITTYGFVSLMTDIKNGKMGEDFKSLIKDIKNYLKK